MAVIDLTTGEIWGRPYQPYTGEHVQADADLIEELVYDADDVLMMPVPYGLPPDERSEYIRHHQRVGDALKERGHDVEVTV